MNVDKRKIMLASIFLYIGQPGSRYLELFIVAIYRALIQWENHWMLWIK